MTSDEQDDLRRRLHLNALFSHITGRDLYLAEQIRSAIAFSLAELEAQTLAHPESLAKYDAAFNAAAAKLLESFYQQHPEHGFFHWDATESLTAADPLFARATIMAGLKRLAPFSESTVLITNLRPAVIPPGLRRTARREQDYEDRLAFIRDLAAARTGRRALLHLLFL